MGPVDVKLNDGVVEEIIAKQAFFPKIFGANSFLVTR